jgi:hypothetical protein
VSPEWRNRFILLAGSVVVALLLSELALRLISVEFPVFSRPDDERGWVLRPGARGRFTAEGGSFVAINQDGRRDKDFARTRPAGVLRIAVLGDSYTEALEVPLEQTFPAVLEASLNRSAATRRRRVEVLNFGIRGYGTAQELLTLRCCVWDYSPDVVLVAFYAENDVIDNSATLDRSPTAYARPYLNKTPAGWDVDRSYRRSWRYWAGKLATPVVAHSRVVQLIIRGQHVFGRRGSAAPSIARLTAMDSTHPSARIYLEPNDPAWLEAWRTTEDLLATMAQETSEHGARFAVVNIPNPIQVYPDSSVRSAFAARIGASDLLLPGRRLRALSERRRFLFLDLTADLQGYADRHHAFLHGFPNTALGVGHWNPLGHRVAGEKIASWMAHLFTQ